MYNTIDFLNLQGLSYSDFSENEKNYLRLDFHFSLSTGLPHLRQNHFPYSRLYPFVLAVSLI